MITKLNYLKFFHGALSWNTGTLTLQTGHPELQVSACVCTTKQLVKASRRRRTKMALHCFIKFADAGPLIFYIVLAGLHTVLVLYIHCLNQAVSRSDRLQP